jgi:hypothetical protein
MRAAGRSTRLWSAAAEQRRWIRRRRWILAGGNIDREPASTAPVPRLNVNAKRAGISLQRSAAGKLPCEDANRRTSTRRWRNEIVL